MFEKFSSEKFDFFYLRIVCDCGGSLWFLGLCFIVNIECRINLKYRVLHVESNEFSKVMIGLDYVCLSIIAMQILQSQSKRHWMYSKSWIEDYRMKVKYGLPTQMAITEYSMETHKIGVVQREDEKSFNDDGYDYRESSTIRTTLKTVAVRNKGDRYEGRLISDFIKLPKNVTHELPNLRVDILLLNEKNENTVNFIGILESPISDGYASLTTSLREKTKNSSVSYEFAMCGNHGRNDMLSIGYVRIRYNDDSTNFDNSNVINAAVIDSYVFKVVAESLTLNKTSLANCEELNNRGTIFDNVLPGIYLPFAIYRRFMVEMFAYGDRHNLPNDMRIWERTTYSCYDGPVDWKYIPEMTITLFATENETFEVSYTGHNLVQRYYTKNSEDTTFCYIFAVRRGDDEHIVLGRAAFEGVKLIFNRSGKSVAFMENNCCGPTIKLNRVNRGHVKMSSCLPKNLRSTMWNFEAYWIWIIALITVASVLTCIMSAPRPSNRDQNSQPTVHIFIPQTNTSQCEFNCPANNPNIAR